MLIHSRARIPASKALTAAIALGFALAAATADARVTRIVVDQPATPLTAGVRPPQKTPDEVA